MQYLQLDLQLALDEHRVGTRVAVCYNVCEQASSSVDHMLSRQSVRVQRHAAVRSRS
jgi:hypothetical protein